MKEKLDLIPSYQFGFLHKRASIKQIHGIVKKINNNMKAGRYYMAVFFDVLGF